MEDPSSGEKHETPASPASQPQSPADPPPAAPLGYRPLRDRAMEWLGEIIIVFVGVYAAFLLNTWQLHRQDRNNHLLILQTLEENATETVKESRAVVAQNQKSFDQFQQDLSTGKMPALHLISFESDYDPADDVALSQEGADHLLNFKTVESLKRVSSVLRQGLMLLRSNQQLSYQLIAPHLDEPKEAFYDPQTKQLKPMFAWYATAEQDANKFAHDYLAANEALLAQVRTERAELR